MGDATPDRFQYDAVVPLTWRLKGLSCRLPHEEERKDAFGEFYRLTRTTIEHHGKAEEEAPAAAGGKELTPHEPVT